MKSDLSLEEIRADLFGELLYWAAEAVN
jgi:hypothetical protein